MENLSFITGVIGNVISILVFASPVGTLKRVVRKRSVGEFKAIPYVCTLLSTCLWSFYGLLKPGGLLVLTVNAAGASLEAIYVAFFLLYSPKHARIKLGKLVMALNVVLFGGIVAVTLLAVRGQQLRLTVIGVMCAGMTLGMYASPLAAMKTVVDTKSVEYMPFSLSFFLFLNGGTWSIYAVLVRDLYIGVPNCIGFLLGSAQLILYMVYKSKSKTKNKAGEEKKEGGSELMVDAEMQTNDDQHEQLQGRDKKMVSLLKEKSITKPAVDGRKSLNKIAKSLSMSVCELRSDWFLQMKSTEAD
ncbi:bidirectional sugar transporter SWEET16 [Nymphaea colorata]|nr:bidirectional sugar transporter SWEET16 [Nymphaea colorata]